MRKVLSSLLLSSLLVLSAGRALAFGSLGLATPVSPTTVGPLLTLTLGNSLTLDLSALVLVHPEARQARFGLGAGVGWRWGASGHMRRLGLTWQGNGIVLADSPQEEGPLADYAVCVTAGNEYMVGPLRLELGASTSLSSTRTVSLEGTFGGVYVNGLMTYRNSSTALSGVIRLPLNEGTDFCVGAVLTGDYAPSQTAELDGLIDGTMGPGTVSLGSSFHVTVVPSAGVRWSF